MEPVIRQRIKQHGQMRITTMTREKQVSSIVVDEPKPKKKHGGSAPAALQIKSREDKQE